MLCSALVIKKIESSPTCILPWEQVYPGIIINPIREMVVLKLYWYKSAHIDTTVPACFIVPLT
jgi:hypothetical protein